MKTAIRRDEMEVLGNRLQAEVQMQFPLRIPLQVKCAIKQQTLIILAQHAYEVSPNPWRTFEVFEQTVRQAYPDLIRSAIATPETLAVRFFLRIAGEHDPYAADGFELELSPADKSLGGVQRAEIAGSPEYQDAVMLSLPAVSTTAVSTTNVEVTNPEVISVEATVKVTSTEATSPEVAVESTSPEAGSVEAGSVEISSVEATCTEATNAEASSPEVADADLPDERVADKDDELVFAAADATQESQVPVVATEATSLDTAHSERRNLQAVSLEANKADRSKNDSSDAVLAVQHPAEQSFEPSELSTDVTSQSKASQSEPASRSWLPLPLLGMAAAAGLFALTASLYALTRPCVIGACEPLQTAQRLSQEAAQLAQANSSAMDVSEAYQKLAEGSYLLGTIPRWSGEYAEAQALLRVYGTQSEALRQVVAALQTANEAAHASQNPPHPLSQWEEIRGMWEEAIALLEQVSTNHPIHPLAQQKLTEYQANLSMINQRIVIEQQAQDKIKLARETARLAEAREGVADSVESWQQAHVTWQVVVNLLQQIPSGTMAHAEAEQLLAIYRPRLEGARDRRLQEEISAKAYNQALTMAEAARQLEQQNQWSQAVSQWRSALANAQQIPTGTSHHGQVQPLVNSYTTSLSQAQETLRSAVAIGNAQTQLEQICAGAVRVCTFAMADEEIRVQITPDYDQAIEQAIANGQAAGNPNAQAEAAAHSNALLRALANVSESTQVPIELYNADGSLFGTYVPELSGYVPNQAAS